MRNEAILLLGPTGAGKTPLGKGMEQHGLLMRRCLHFDFGAQLRNTAEHGCSGLTSTDISIVRSALSGGALLENDTFHIARTILNVFMADQHAGPEDLVVLNGLPRHIGQAYDVDRMLRVILVVALECTAEVTHKRIALNSGGDRTERADDSVEEVARKLEIYAARTRPLLDHYRSTGVPCHLVPVGIKTTSSDILSAVNTLHP